MQNLSEIVIGGLFVSDGVLYEASAPHQDSLGVLRFYLKNLSDASQALHLAAAVQRGAQFFHEDYAIGDVCVMIPDPAIRFQSYHVPGSVDLANIPVVYRNGAYELPGGGRVVVIGDKRIAGRGGNLIDIDQTGLIPGATRVESLVAPQDLESGTLFVHGTRVFRRRDHGIEPVDGLERVPLKEIGSKVIPLTKESTPRLVAGDFFSENHGQLALHGKVLAVNGNMVDLLYQSGKLTTRSYSVTKFPPTSEFASGDLFSYEGNAIRKISSLPDGVVLPAGVPEAAVMALEKTLVTYEGHHYLISSVRRERTRMYLAMCPYKISNSLGFDHWRRDPSTSQLNYEAKIVGGLVYGVPKPTTTDVPLEFGRPAIAGELWLDVGSRAYRIGTDGYAHDTRDALDVHNPRMLHSLRWDDGTHLSRRLAGPGEWYIKFDDGDPCGRPVIETSDDSYPSQSGPIPIRSGQRRRIEAIYNHACPRCRAPMRVDAGNAVVSTEGTTIRVCVACANSMTNCPSCHARTDEPNNHFGVCANCYRRGDFQSVHDYGYRPKPKFRGGGPLFFGVETELVPNGRVRYDRNGIAREIAELSRGLVYGKRDGSIGDGIEFVTHPFDLNWLQENEASMKALFDKLAVSMTDASNCGIHIHTSKIGFEVDPNSLPASDARSNKVRRIGRGLLRVQRFVYGNPKLIIHFAGRESRQYASLAVGSGGTNVKDMIRLSRDIDARKEGRYAAVNMTKDTVEFRVFKSTVKYDEWKRNVLFIHSVVEYCKSTALPKNGEIGIAKYRAFLVGNPAYRPVLEHLDRFGSRAVAASSSTPTRDDDDDHYTGNDDDYRF